MATFAKRNPNLWRSSHACHTIVAAFSRAMTAVMLCNWGVETLIVCLGNARISDDGIGAMVGKVLQAVPLPSTVTVCLAPRVTLALLDKIASADQLVLVEALACAEEPGTCTVVDVTDLPASVASSECVHRSEVREILDIVRYVACDGSCSGVAIAGIELGQSEHCGTAFTKAVWTAIPRLVDLILLYVGANLAARSAVKDAFHRLVPEVGEAEVWPPSDARLAG